MNMNNQGKRLKYISSAILATTVLALTGCSATGPAFKEAASPPTGKALVYIYRPSAFALSLRDAHFFVDGENLVHLSNNGYTQTYLSEGRHQIMQRWNDTTLAAVLKGGNTKTVEVPLDAKAGEIYYFRFTTSIGDYAYNAMALAWQLQQVSPEVGAVEILQTNYQPETR